MDTKIEEKSWNLKSEISELNSVPQLSFVLREEGEMFTIVDFPDGKLKEARKLRSIGL